MVDLETARTLCLSLPQAEEYDHFGKPAYRVKKKIFATLELDKKRGVLKLPKSAQSELCEEFHPAVYPVNNKWGEHGWTHVELNKMSEVSFTKLLKVAWAGVAPKTLTKKK